MKYLTSGIPFFLGTKTKEKTKSQRRRQRFSVMNKKKKKNKIKSRRRRVFIGGGNEKEECPICKVEFEDGEEIIPCNTCKCRFHGHCIRQSFAYKRTCPCCREPITLNITTEVGTITYNWGVYTGELQNGLKHGQGKMEFRYGHRVYEGSWKDDNMNGLGEIRDDYGVYNGLFENGGKCGQGIMVYANGDVYDGIWWNDSKYGKGMMKFANTGGSEYDGDWANNFMHGKGKLFFGNHTIFKLYDGDWRSNHMHGKGVLYYVNGDKYVGNFLENQRVEGEGTMIYANGTSLPIASAASLF